MSRKTKYIFKVQVNRDRTSTFYVVTDKPEDLTAVAKRATSNYQGADNPRPTVKMITNLGYNVSVIGEDA